MYSTVYAHRDAEEAERAAELLLPRLPSGRVLDLGCGSGRYLKALAARGRWVVGLDLSPELLAEARAALPEAPLVRADMRALPFRAETFGAVISMFSSFGYFDSAEEDRRVLQEAARVLRRPGALVLDLSNPRQVRDNSGGATERAAGRYTVREVRKLGAEGRTVEKSVVIATADGRVVESYTERLRLYEPEELEALLGGLSFVPGELWGDYRGAAFGPSAPRMLRVFTRPGG